MNWKRIGVLSLVAFLVYFIVRAPVESADVVHNIVTSTGHFLNSLAVALTTFLQALF